MSALSVALFSVGIDWLLMHYLPELLGERGIIGLLVLEFVAVVAIACEEIDARRDRDE